jgi:hypothetical protein
MKFTDHQKRGGASLATAMVALIWTAAAHSQVYRCTTNGKVTYSDTQCAVNTKRGPATPPDTTVQQSTGVPVPAKTTAASFYGGWTGQAQYQATTKGQSVDAAHAVVNLALVIAPDGKLSGDSKDNGCHALGIASPQSSQTLKLDVSLTGCQYAGYNRRYTGTFGLPPGKDYATVSLLAYDVRPGTPSAMYDIKATMQR